MPNSLRLKIVGHWQSLPLKREVDGDGGGKGDGKAGHRAGLPAQVLEPSGSSEAEELNLPKAAPRAPGNSRFPLGFCLWAKPLRGRKQE